MGPMLIAVQLKVRLCGFGGRGGIRGVLATQRAVRFAFNRGNMAVQVADGSVPVQEG